MGFSFRKRVKIMPGLSVNFGKRGASVTVGRRGASMNFSKRGTTVNMGIPGTGISYRKMVSRRKQNSQAKGSTYISHMSNAGMSSVSPHSQNNMSDQEAGVILWILFIVLWGIAGLCFYNCFSSDFSSPLTIMFAYTIASIFVAIGGILLGFLINAYRNKGSDLPINLGVVGLILSALTFIIWSSSWPPYAHGYREYYGHKFPELIDLDGWITFGQTVSWIAIILAVIICFVTFSDRNNK